MWAEVKLRIYLQDGTLQAGNLVAETENSFVILNKEERLEIKKDKIMFINGKTLKQWQERPDKLFQTEIIPSDIPNPAYVNDKAPNPPPPSPATQAAAKSAPVPATEKSVVPATGKAASASAAAASATATTAAPQSAPVIAPVKPLSEVAAAKATPTPAPTPVAANPTPAPTPAAAKRTPAPTPAPVVKSEEPKAAPVAKKEEPKVEPVVAAAPAAPVEKRRKKNRHHRSDKTDVAAVPPAKPAPEKSLPVPPDPTTIPTETASLSAVAGIARPSGFQRKEMGDYHFARAVAYEKAGARGQAIQELHISTLLDRQNPDSVYMLGKLYFDEGQKDRAEKYFNHPLVKKRPEIETFTKQLEQAEKKQEQNKNILYGLTAVGALAWIPLLLIVRRFRKKTKRVITAESIEVTKNIIEDVIEEVAEKGPAFKPQMPSPVPPRTAPPVAPVLPENSFAGKPEPVVQQKPVTPAVPPAPVVSPVPLLPPAPVTPPAPIVTGIPAPISLPPAVPPIVPPIITPPVGAPEPAPEPVAVPAFFKKVEGLDTESVLRLASMVDRAVRKGNAYAIDNQYDLARREYRTALALNPACLEAYLGLGYLCFTQGQWDLALEHYSKAIAIDSNSADAHYGIGRVMLETEHVDEAVYEFQKTLALDTMFDDARETLTSLGVVV